MRRFLTTVVVIAALVGGAAPSAGTDPVPRVDGGPGLVHDIKVIEGYYKAHPGKRDRFAGVWIKRGQPRKLMVMVTDDPPARPYPWEPDIADPDQLRFRSVEFSLHDLNRIRWAVRRDWDQPWAKAICGMGVYVKKNVVHFTT